MWREQRIWLVMSNILSMTALTNCFEQIEPASKYIKQLSEYRLANKNRWISYMSVHTGSQMQTQLYKSDRNSELFSKSTYKQFEWERFSQPFVCVNNRISILLSVHSYRKRTKSLLTVVSFRIKEVTYSTKVLFLQWTKSDHCASVQQLWSEIARPCQNWFKGVMSAGHERTNHHKPWTGNDATTSIVITYEIAIHSIFKKSILRCVLFNCKRCKGRTF